MCAKGATGHMLAGVSWCSREARHRRGSRIPLPPAWPPAPPLQRCRLEKQQGFGFPVAGLACRQPASLCRSRTEKAQDILEQRG